MSNVLEPVTIRLFGNEADSHHIDAEELGLCMQGTAKLYNAALYLYHNGEAPGARSTYKLKMHAGAKPVEKGSVTYAIWAAMVMGEMAVYPQLWGDIADLVVPKIVKAVYAKLVKRENEVIEAYKEINAVLVEREKALLEDRQLEREHVQAINKEHAEQTKLRDQTYEKTFSRVMDSQDCFVRAIERISDNNKTAAKNSVAPVGRTSKGLEHKRSDTIMVAVDEATAEALRSKDELEVDDMKSYKGKILGANKIKGSCDMLLDGFDKPVPCKIADPAIMQVGNIYTRALDQDLIVTVKAKALLKDGQIKTLFISDAEAA